ncbi:DUF1707 domain-containing protein [Amycolatopsis sp. NPDC005003]
MGSDELRIGTAEREEAARLLADHFGMGRISPDEYESRVTDAYAAMTLGDLRPLFRDLPHPHPGFFGPPAGPAQMPTQVYAPPSAPVAMPYGPPPVVYSPRSRTVAGVLQIVLPFGVGRFYTGQTGLGVAQLFATFCTGVGVFWPIIDGIMLLVNGGTDAEGRPLRP